MVEKDLQDLAAGLVVQFLGISRIGDWLLLRRVEQADMSKSTIISCRINVSRVCSLRSWYIAHKDPLDFEDTLPLVRCPDGRILRFIHPAISYCLHRIPIVDLRCKHLGYTAKVSGPVDGEKQVDRTFLAKLAESSVEPLVTEHGRGPDLMLERLLDIFLLNGSVDVCNSRAVELTVYDLMTKNRA